MSTKTKPLSLRKVSNKEKAEIYSDYVNGLSIERLIKKYGRPEETVTKCIADHETRIKIENTPNIAKDVLLRLHTKHFWRELKNQLFDKELKYFEQSWINLTEQFSQYDILETDEMIMKDLIMQDILINRNLTERKRIMSEMDYVQRELDVEMERGSNGDRARIENCYRKLSNLRSNLETFDKVHSTLQQRKDTKFRDMKATRDQRYKQIEEAKTSWFDLLKSIDEYKRRKEEGEWLALMKKSIENQKEKLSHSIKYADDTYDLPLLTPETVS